MPEHHIASIYPGSSKLAYNNIIKRLVRIIKTHKIHNIDFIFLTIDNINKLSQESNILLENFPAFMSSKNLESKLERNKLLLLDPYILDNEKWPNLINQINEASKTYSWSKKNRKNFLAGSDNW
jgi:23S rRNA A2030 N6-methylase RlmJ